MRKEAGEDMLIELRMSGSDGADISPGWKTEEAVEFASVVQDKVDMFQVYCGDITIPETYSIMHPTGFLPEATNVCYTKAFRELGKIKKPVVAIGAINSPETAERLIAEGWADALVEMAAEPAAGAQPTYRQPLMEKLYAGVTVSCGMRCAQINESSALCVDAAGEQHLFRADTVVLSSGMLARGGEARALVQAAGLGFMVGDCVRPGNVRAAVRTAYDTAILF